MSQNHHVILLPCEVGDLLILRREMLWSKRKTLAGSCALLLTSGMIF